MSAFRLLYQCIISPRLYKVYGDGRAEGLYDPGHLEKWGDQLINIVYFFWNFGFYASPVIATILYKRGYMLWDSAVLVGKCTAGMGIVLAFSLFVRGFGRINSPQYVQFLRTLDAAKKDMKNSKKNLAQYDFDFGGWPIEFKWNDVEGEAKKERIFMDRHSLRRTSFDFLFAAPCRILTYIVAHTFGLKLMYPGCMTVWNYMFFPVLLQGRSKLILENGGERYKLYSRDGNEIDAMFIDRRKKHANGDVLVICSEGNAGFYEIGIMTTPIDCGFSVLGWNHPGFGGSTGKPFPPQELNAMDCIMQFAIHSLGFQPHSIILFGWSIGGFPTTWAAMNYPEVKGIILDATFDDVMPLAVTRMPSVLEPVIRRTIREYMNLNNSEQILKYPGPIRIVRRTEDDVICTEDNNISSNRGNHLLVKLLKYRYPAILNDKSIFVLNEWLGSDVLEQRAGAASAPGSGGSMAADASTSNSNNAPAATKAAGTAAAAALARDAMSANEDDDTSDDDDDGPGGRAVRQRARLWEKVGVDEDLCSSTIISYVTEHSNSYPMKLGEGFSQDMKFQMTLFLASKYLTDFRAGHCSPLPNNLFLLPWDVATYIT